MTPEQINQQGWSQLLHPEEAPRILSNWEHAFTQGEALTEEFRYRMADGSYRWFLGRIVPLKDRQDQIVQWIGSATDIDAIKRFEQELVTRERQFRTLAENSPDVISRLDRQYRHLYVNPAIHQATGLTPEEFIGKTHAQIGMPEEIYQPWYAKMGSVFETGQGCSFEFDFPAPDGIRHYLARFVPEFNATGEVETILGITSDITDLKRTEQALRVSETRFRRVLECDMIGMGFWDIEGNIVLANDALLNMIGYAQAEVQAGKLSWRAITPREYDTLENKALQEIAERGFCSPFEKEYIHKNGSRIPILCGGATFEDSHQSGVFFAIDLSELKAIQKECDRLLKTRIRNNPR